MKRFSEIFRNTFSIGVRRTLSLGQRVALLGAYWRVIGKRFLRRFHFSWIDYTQQRFLGLTVSFDNFEDFYWTFLEVFVKDEYGFVPKNTHPNILDCGGNIGMTTLYFKWLMPTCHVTVFEPEARNVEIIRRNIEQNKLSDVALVEAAVGAEEGVLMLSGTNRAATIHPERTGVDEAENLQEVAIKKLSQYVPQSGIDFVKMDIEGAEDDVLGEMAASGALLRVQALTFEYHQREQDTQERFDALCALLEKSGLAVLPLTETLHPQRRTHVMVRSFRKI